MDHSLIDPALMADDALTRGVLRRRVLAFLVDGLLVTALCAVLWLVLLLFGLLTLGLGLPLLGVLPFVPLLYNGLSVASPLSATPGQRLLGLLVRRNADLGPPTPLEAAVWAVGFMLTLAAGVFWLAAALVTVRRRALHDLVSGLVVVRAGALAEAASARGPLTVSPSAWNAAPGGPTWV